MHYIWNKVSRATMIQFDVQSHLFCDSKRQSKGDEGILLKDAMDKTTVQSLMGELRSGLQVIYGGRLKGVYLYGSYARGDADPESDLDLLVVLDRIEHYAGEVGRTGQLAADLSLQYSVSVTEVFMSEADWVSAETPFLANVRGEAIAA